MTPKQLANKIKIYYAKRDELAIISSLDANNVDSCSFAILRSDVVRPDHYDVNPETLKQVAKLIVEQYEAELADDLKLFKELGLEV